MLFPAGPHTRTHTHTRMARRFPEKSINRNAFPAPGRGKKGSPSLSLRNWPTDWDPKVRAFVLPLLSDGIFFLLQLSSSGQILTHGSI